MGPRAELDCRKAIWPTSRVLERLPSRVRYCSRGASAARSRERRQATLHDCCTVFAVRTIKCGRPGNRPTCKPVGATGPHQQVVHAARFWGCTYLLKLSSRLVRPGKPKDAGYILAHDHR